MMPTLAEIRLRACKLWPYGSHAILSLVPVERPGFGTLAVDQHWRLYFDPKLIASEPLDESAGVIIHEISHLLLKHHRRASRVVPLDAGEGAWKTWNVAADYAINSMLRDEGIPLWEGGLCPVQDGLPPGLSAEDYFRRLVQQGEEQAQEQDEERGNESDEADETTNSHPGEDSDNAHDNAADSDNDDSEQDESGEEGGANSDANSGDEGQDDGKPGGESDRNTKGDAGDQQGDGSADGDGQSSDDAGEAGEEACTGPSSRPGCGDGGSCADGRPRPWELPAPDECDTPGMAPHEADIMAAETAKRITEKSRGTGGGMWQRWAEQVLNPRIDPRIALLRHVRAAVEQAAGLGDYSYRRPNRRNPRPDMLLPAAVQPVPRIVVLVDTSGSMDQRDLGLCLGLIGKVLNGFRIRDGIQVVTGDVRAVTAARVFDPKQVKLAGGGGTDMGSMIRDAVALKPKPQLIVVANDGDTPWCERVSIPVVACLTQSTWRSRVPAWIKTVVLEDSQGRI